LKQQHVLYSAQTRLESLHEGWHSLQS